MKHLSPIYFWLFFAYSVLADTALALRTVPYPYAIYFEEAELVIIARCTKIEILSKEKCKNGTSASTLKATFQKQATFKGSSKQEFIESDYNEVEITDATIAKNLGPRTLEMLDSVISKQPIYEVGKTYLIFMSPKVIISAIEVPDRP